MFTNGIIKNKINYIYFLLIIFFIHIAINYYVLRKSQIARIHDEAQRIGSGLEIYRLLFESPPGKIEENLHYIFYLNRNGGHPPILDIAQSLSWKVLNTAKIIDIEIMILLTNSVFLFILLFSVFGIGREIYNREVGLLAAFLVSMFPRVFGHTRVVMYDFPLMCMVSLCIFLLLKTKGFSSFLYSILFGIILGLSQLTKEASIIFIFAPVSYYSIKSFSNGVNKNRAVINLSIAMLFFFVLSGSVYFRTDNLPLFKSFLMQTYYFKNNNNPFFYFNDFIKMTGIFIFFLSLPLLFSCLINIKNRNKMLLLWLFIPVLLFSLSPNKTTRFLLPVLPAFALIVSGEVFANHLLTRIRGFCVFVLVTFSILQYVFLNCGFWQENFNYYIMSGILSVKKDQHLPVSMTMLDIFKKEAEKNKSLAKMNICFLFHNAQIHCPLKLNVSVFNLPFRVFCPLEVDEIAAFLNRQIDLEKEVLSADYIIDIATDAQEARYREIRYSAYVGRLAKEIKDAFLKSKDQFVVISEIKVFDGSNIYIYKKSIPDA